MKSLINKKETKMDSNLILKLLKIIKQSKKAVIEVFEEDFSVRTSYVDFNHILENVQKATENLASSIKNEANTFNRNYSGEKQIIKSINNSFENINSKLRELITIHNDIKSNISKDNIQALLSLQITRKVLNDYISTTNK